MGAEPRPDQLPEPMTWEAFRDRALDECWRLGIVPPPDDELRAEYIRRQGDLARLRAWLEANP